MPKTICKSCNNNKVDVDPVTNSTVCTKCGFVIDDGGVVSDIQFEENSNGTSSVVGHFVSSESKGPTSTGVSNNRDSREYTINRARKFIQAVGEHLRLSAQCQNVAINFFKMALSSNLTRGRKSSYLYGACMYMACRLERTSHLLIDFADHMQVNFTLLGRTFIDISSALSIYMPVMDPSIYILRFVNQMNLGNKLNDVASTALRILKRMKKDMIDCGRRPSGLCGAALYIAARFHNFTITVADIVKIVHITHSTLKKRLIEFTDTPSSLLTVDKFLQVDLPEIQDPPSFKKGQKAKFKLPKSLRTKKCDQEFIILERLIEQALDAKKKRNKSFGLLGSLSGIGKLCKEGSLKDGENGDIENIVMGTTLDCIDSCVEQALSTTDNSEEGPSVPRVGMRPTWETMGMWESPDEKINPEGFEQIEENSSDELDDLDEDEIDSYILPPANVEAKSKAWYEINGEFMAKQKERKERLSIEQPQDKKIIKKRKRNPPIHAATAEEAVEKVIREKKLSDKINYDILEGLDINVFTKAKEAKDIADSIQREQDANESPEEVDVTVDEDCDPPTEKFTIVDVEKALNVAPFKKSSTNMPKFRCNPFDFDKGFENQLSEDSNETNKMPNMLDAVIKHSMGGAWGRNVERNNAVAGDTVVGNERSSDVKEDSEQNKNILCDEVQSLLQLLSRKDKFESMMYPTPEKNNTVKGKIRKKSGVKKPKRKTNNSKLSSSEDIKVSLPTVVSQKKRKLNSTNNTERSLSINKLTGHLDSNNYISKMNNGKGILTMELNRAVKKDESCNSKERKKNTKTTILKNDENVINKKLGSSKDTIKNILWKKTKIQEVRNKMNKKGENVIKDKLGRLKDSRKNKLLEKAKTQETKKKVNILKNTNTMLLKEKLKLNKKNINKKVNAPGQVGQTSSNFSMGITSETKVPSDIKATDQEKEKCNDPKTSRAYKYCHKNTSSNAVGPAVSISFVNNDKMEYTTTNQTEAGEQLMDEELEIPDSIESMMELVRQDLSNISANPNIASSAIDNHRRKVLNNIPPEVSTNSTSTGSMSKYPELDNDGSCDPDTSLQEDESIIDEDIDDDDDDEDDEGNESDGEEEIISMQDALMRHMNDMAEYDY